MSTSSTTGADATDGAPRCAGWYRRILLCILQRHPCVGQGVETAPTSGLSPLTARLYDRAGQGDRQGPAYHRWPGAAGETGAAAVGPRSSPVCGRPPPCVSLQHDTILCVSLVVSEGADAPEDNKKPPGPAGGHIVGRRTSMILDIIGILVALPASMVAAVTLYRTAARQRAAPRSWPPPSTAPRLVGPGRVVAPAIGLEPITVRLTVGCSAIELRGNRALARGEL